MIVSKFGGTSVKDANAMRQVAKLVMANSKRRVIVLSATSGTTNELSDLVDYITQNTTSRDVIDYSISKIREKHIVLYRELLGTEPEETFYTLFSGLEKIVDSYLISNDRKRIHQKNRIISFGEVISTTIFSLYLQKINVKNIWLDAREVIVTKNSQPLLENIKGLAKDKITPFLNENIVVTQGFIASTVEGKTTTLGRGGSDYSASLFAYAIDAELLEIWTDVTGIKSCDPRVVSNPKSLAEISYKEAAELSSFGAKVVHPLTLAPTQKRDIPVFIGSTLEPEVGGTLITSKPTDVRAVKALARRDNQTLLTLSSVEMIGTPGFLARVFATLADYEMNVDVVTTSEASVAITLNGNNNGYGGKVILSDELLNELNSFCKVKIEDDLSLIALIGNRPDGYFHFQKNNWDPDGDINVRLFCQGASIHNVCFLISTDDADRVINNLHDSLIHNTIENEEPIQC